jgi:hypothetical protein
MAGPLATIVTGNSSADRGRDLLGRKTVRRLQR